MSRTALAEKTGFEFLLATSRKLDDTRPLEARRPAQFYNRDEQAVADWRAQQSHRKAQAAGRQTIFDKYRIRVAHVIRDYGMEERDEAPEDSKEILNSP